MVVTELSSINSSGVIAAVGTTNSVCTEQHALLLVPMQLQGYSRGAINSPGSEAPNTGRDYGQSTVMVENANDEEVAWTPDYTTNTRNGKVDANKDTDLVQVVLYWPKGLAVNGTLQLTAVGMQVDVSQQPASSSSVTETGPSCVNFYYDQGNALTAGDFVINPSSPDGSYMDKLVSTGACTLFIEGGQNFGLAGSQANAGKSMGGAVMKYQFAPSGTTTTMRLLVYRGGFLDFQVPNAPGTPGTFCFYDGKGRVYIKPGTPIFGNEFSGDGSDATDYGNQLYSWSVKSGKLNGAAYNIPEGRGHTPLGWFTYYMQAPPSDPDHPYQNSPTKILQGAMVRWAQDNATDASQSGLPV